MAATLALGTVVPAVAGDAFKKLADGTELTATEIVGGLDRPSRLFVDTEGALWIVCAHDGKVIRRTVDGTTTQVGRIDVDAYDDATGQHGVLSGLAVRPLSNGGYEVFLGVTRSNSTALILKATSDGRTMDTPVLILPIPDVPYNRRIDIEPIRDGSLLVAVPAFDTPAPLSPATVTGKVIRIMDDGTPALDNPFADPASATTPSAYIWTLGHRNVSGITSRDGSLESVFAVEAGPVGADEVNLLLRGKNYGWYRKQGYCTESSLTNTCPKVTFSSIPFDVSFYTSSSIPSWNNSLLVASVNEPSVLIMHIDEAGNVIEVNEQADPFDTYHKHEDRTLRFLRDGEQERPVAVAALPDGSISVALETLDGRGRVVRVAAVPGTTTVQATEAATWTVAPLPADQSVIVTRRGGGLGPLPVELRDVTGRVLFRGMMPDGAEQFEFKTAALPSGTYLVRAGGWSSTIPVRH
jgi:glucose/arabinose dehydrogenase